MTNMWNFLRKYKVIVKQWQAGNSICFHSVSPHAADLRHTHSVTFQSLKEHIVKVGMIREFIPATTDRFIVANSKVAITFDDAYRDILDEAIPYLISKKIPATIFINSSTLAGGILWRDKLRLILDANLGKEFCTALPEGYDIRPDDLYFKSKSPELNSAKVSAYIDSFVRQKGLGLKERLYLNARELSQLNGEESITLGNHTRNHYVLSSLSVEEQLEEIVGGLRDLEEYGLDVSNIFAAPFGGYSTINKSSLNILEDTGYKGLLLTNGNEKINLQKVDKPSKLIVANRYLPSNS